MTTKYRLNLVLPLDIWNAIKKSSANNRRSATQEIIRAIEFYLKNSPETHYTTQK